MKTLLKMFLVTVASVMLFSGCGSTGGSGSNNSSPTTLTGIGGVPDDFDWQGSVKLTLDITALSPRDAVLDVKFSDGKELFSGLIQKGQTINKTFKISSTEDSLEFKLSSNGKVVTKVVATSDLLQNPSVVLELQTVDGYVKPDPANEEG